MIGNDKNDRWKVRESSEKVREVPEKTKSNRIGKETTGNTSN